jgi:hypothetical protein
MQRAHQSPRCTAHSKPWLSMQKSCGARLGGMSDAWRRWWSAYWPSASELSPRVTDEGYVRDARHDTGVKRNYRMGGHIILWQGIAEPPLLTNFLCGQLKGKKLGQMPSPTCGKERVAHMGDEQIQWGVQNLQAAHCHSYPYQKLRALHCQTRTYTARPPCQPTKRPTGMRCTWATTLIT